MLDTITVGAGLAGLACARELNKRGASVLLIDSADAVGGRVRTDQDEGFLLDRGFQVLLTAYPEAQRQLDYARLELCTFTPGALIHHGGKFHALADPLRAPSHAIATAFSNMLTFRDKFEIARLWMNLRGKPPATLFRGEQHDTLTFLNQNGFSQRGIDSFFTPFFGGVFLDDSLHTSSRFFQFLFQCFAQGTTTVPRLGMQQIPRQMAADLPGLRVLLNTAVHRVEKSGNNRYAVHTASGETLEARTVVVATDATTAQRLLLQSRAETRRTTTVTWNGTTTLYYAASRAPVDGPILLLNGEGRAGGPINHAAVMTNVSAAYAPEGAHLICANIVGHPPQEEAARARLEEDARTQLRRWFGPQAGQWRLVGGYFIPQALPMQRYAEWEQGPTSVKISAARGRKEEAQEIFLCGDYCETASIQGALVSGRRTAEAVAARLERT